MDNSDMHNEQTSQTQDQGRKPSLKSRFSYFSGLMEKNAGKLMKKQDWVDKGEKAMSENKPLSSAKKSTTNTTDSDMPSSHTDTSNTMNKMSSDLKSGDAEHADRSMSAHSRDSSKIIPDDTGANVYSD
ncbi:hypothetical protein BB560_005884 [Smittium megazygosporum]|uniref:Uncharacterized protein n=1 Tax=Smittium megazygosporum TaxID=133381 RepID=A0A2T9YS02_9FUNG|nr:hypothetical protein BB560_005884 [Smittium megazygosporum]